ncbi:Histidine phosphatase superfamily (branch 1) [Phytophthora infestans]|uniref:Serine/threonine-protein phosphatase PGAM5, mitochondrial n=1 Tax=Phytophthora infestans TaxID=4787 RepID=A0A833T2Z1_PHYIN|nr:Histidine phosphatase superfamily (branch 1) [Phytophthora infestans]
MSLDLAVTPASASGKGGGGCSVKTESVRMQKLLLAGEGEQGTRSSPKRKQRPASGTVPIDLTTFSEELPANQKRGHKRALLTSLPGERRRDGEAVEVEGLLVVAELVGKGQDSSVFRTLGSIYCVLVRKSSGLSLETVSKDSHHTIVLDVDAMDLVHEPSANDLKFQLHYQPSSSGNGLRSPSYTFTASTKEEYVEWVNGILRFQGREQENTVSKSTHSPVSSSDTSVRTQQGKADTNARREDQQTLPRQQDHKSHQQVQSSLGEFVYATPPRTKHIILVRHGHYINAHVPQVSDSEQVLSQMGRQQAEQTGKCLAMAHNRVPTRHDITVYHSDMTRAVETAGIISNNFGEVLLNPSPLLREGWPGLPYSSSPVIGGGTGARDNSAYDGMQERSRMDVKRMQKAFNRFFLSSGEAQDESDEESYCVLVCHANLIRFFLCRALGTNTWGHFEINHCGITRIDVCANRPIKVTAVNETGHLPQSLITSSEDHL